MPPLPTLSQVGPTVVAQPVPAVAAEPLPVEPEVAEVQAPSADTVVAVRLGEYGSQTGVDASWQLLRRLYPDVLQQARLLESTKLDEEKRPLVVGPFTEVGALSVCARLIADGQSCRVTRARL